MPSTVLLVGDAQGLLRTRGATQAGATGAVRSLLRGAGRSTAPFTPPRRRVRVLTPPRRASGTARASGAATTLEGELSPPAKALPMPTADRSSKVSGLVSEHGCSCSRLRVGGRVREPRRRGDVVAPQHARRPAGPRRLERPGEPAARPPRPAGDPAAPGLPPVSSSSQGDRGSSRSTDDGSRRGRRATAACGPTGRARTPRSASACTSS